VPETNATFAITIRKEIAKAFLSAVYLLKCKLAFQILDFESLTAKDEKSGGQAMMPPH